MRAIQPVTVVPMAEHVAQPRTSLFRRSDFNGLNLDPNNIDKFLSYVQQHYAADHYLVTFRGDS